MVVCGSGIIIRAHGFSYAPWAVVLSANLVQNGPMLGLVSMATNKMRLQGRAQDGWGVHN
jgi:hypothetical protein